MDEIKITQAAKFEMEGYDIINNTIRSGVTFLETDDNKKIISDMSVDSENGVLSIMLADSDDVPYVIMYEDAIVPVEAIHIVAADDGAYINMYDINNMNTPILSAVMGTNEYLSIENIGDDIYKMKVKPVPSHFVYYIPEVMKQFPIMHREMSIEYHSPAVCYCTRIYAYLNPHVFDKVLVDTVYTPMNKTYHHHVSEVNYKETKFKDINTTTLVNGSLIVERLPERDSILKIISIGPDYMVCDNLTSPEGGNVIYYYETLTLGNVFIIPPYLAVFGYYESGDDKNSGILHIPDKYADVNVHVDVITELVECIDYSKCIDNEKLNAVLQKAGKGEKINHRLKIVKTLKQYYTNIRRALEILDDISYNDIPFLEVLFIYRYNDTKLSIINKNDLWDELEKVNDILSKLGIKLN